MHKSQCKICKLFYTKKFSKLANNGKNAICVDNFGLQWVGHICPYCHHKRITAKRTPLVPTERTCRICNTKFFSVGKKYYCNKACKPKRVYVKRVYVYKPSPPRIKTCLRCKTEFQATGRQTYCKPSCRDSSQYVPVVYSKVCVVCSKEYATNQSTSTKCHRTCRPPILCIVCGVQIKKGKYCSRTCKPKIPINKEALKKYKKAARKTRKLKQKKQKPKWAKGLSLVYNQRPDGKEVDHIIPLNHPDVCGFHSPDNLQYLSIEENHMKSNQFDGTYENNSWRKSS